MSIYYKGKLVTTKNMHEVEDAITDLVDTRIRSMLKALDGRERAAHGGFGRGPTYESQLLHVDTYVLRDSEFKGGVTHLIRILGIEIGWSDGSGGAYGPTLKHVLKKMESMLPSHTFITIKGKRGRIRIEAEGSDMTKIKGIYVTEGA